MLLTSPLCPGPAAAREAPASGDLSLMSSGCLLEPPADLDRSWSVTRGTETSQLLEPGVGNSGWALPCPPAGTSERRLPAQLLGCEGARPSTDSAGFPERERLGEGGGQQMPMPADTDV